MIENDVLTIANKVENEFNLEFNYIDGNILNIHSSNFDYKIIEFIENEFDIDVEFYYVHDDTTFVDIELNI